MGRFIAMTDSGQEALAVDFDIDGRKMVNPPKGSPPNSQPVKAAVCRRMIEMFGRDGIATSASGKTIWVFMTYCHQKQIPYFLTFHDNGAYYIMMNG